MFVQPYRLQLRNNIATTNTPAINTSARCYSRDIVRATDARARSPLFGAAALVAAVWMLTIMADSGLPWMDAAAPHHPHTVTTPHNGGSAVLLDHHPHLGAGSIPAAPHLITAALPPRAATALAALGLMAALAATTALLAPVVLPAMRGPPWVLAALLTGQQVLTRHCIARH